jgi:hypothetical protein
MSVWRRSEQVDNTMTVNTVVKIEVIPGKTGKPDWVKADPEVLMWLLHEAGYVEDLAAECPAGG